MSTKIRLQRGGAKKKPFYRIVIADSRAPRDGKFIEKVGTFDPITSKDFDKRVNVKKERIEYWLSQGAVPTEKVAIIIKQLGISNDNTALNRVLDKRAKTIELKKEEIAAKKKAEEEAKKLAEAEAKKKADEEAKEAAEAEKAAAEAAEAEKASAEASEAEAPATEETPAEEASAPAEEKAE